jgi:hypothetical protein
MKRIKRTGKNRPFPGGYRFGAKTYREDYLIFHRQSPYVLRELRTVKIIMAALIPLFFVISVLSTRLAAVLGCLCAVLLFLFFLKKKRFKPAAAAPVSIVTGIVFGIWIKYQLGG